MRDGSESLQGHRKECKHKKGGFKGQEFLGGNELLWIQYFTQGASEVGGEAIKVN